MADLGIIFLRRKHTIHWYQSLFTITTGSMPFRYFWATLYTNKSTPILIVCAAFFEIHYGLLNKINHHNDIKFIHQIWYNLGGSESAILAVNIVSCMEEWKSNILVVILAITSLNPLQNYCGIHGRGGGHFYCRLCACHIRDHPPPPENGYIIYIYVFRVGRGTRCRSRKGCQNREEKNEKG